MQPSFGEKGSRVGCGRRKTPEVKTKIREGKKMANERSEKKKSQNIRETMKLFCKQ